MCEKCNELITKYYPDLEWEEQYDILICATCFPFGQPEDIERQLKELVEKTDGTVDGAMAFADAEMELAMESGTQDSILHNTAKKGE